MTASTGDIQAHLGEGAKFWMSVLTELRNRGIPIGRESPRTSNSF